ncbi:MAG: translocation/assembly module TamB domain-containing protein [Halanaerobiales bacterium]|nr:translocation/assembly module TamB domain-containing protein [Halanaerobiales bacterium]
MKVILNTGKKIIPLLVLLIFLGVCLALFFFSDQITERAKTVLIQVVQQQLGEDLKIDKITLFPLNRVTFHDVKMMNGKKSFVEVERITASFYLHDLLKGVEGLVNGIRDVKLISPKVYLEKDEDGFGFEKFITTKDDDGTTTLNFKPKIRIENGTIYYNDGKISETLINLNGIVQIQESEINLNLKGEMEGSNLAEFDLKGKVGSNIKFDLDFEELSLTVFEEYGIQIPEVRNLGGKGTGAIQIQKDDKNWTYSGRVAITNGEVEVEVNKFSLLINEIKGNIAFNEDQAVVESLTGQTEMGGFKINGQVSNFENPDLFLTITSSTDGFKLAELLSMVPQLTDEEITGFIKGTVDVSGNWKDLQIKGDLNVPKIGYRDLKLQNVNIKWRYQKALLSLKELSFGIGEGKVEGYSGFFNFQNPEELLYTLNLDVKKVDMYSIFSSIPLSIESDEIVNGILSGKIYLSGKGLNFDALTAFGHIDIENGQYGQFPFDTLNTNFWVTSGDIGLSKVEFKAPYLKTVLTGLIDLDGEIVLNLKPSNIDLNWFGDVFQIPLEGKGTLIGEVYGSLNDPTFEGEIDFDQGQILNNEFDRLIGHLEVNKSKLTLYDASFLKGPSSFQMTGKADFEKKDIDLHVDVLYSSLTEILEILDFMDIPFNITGDITGEIDLTGSWSKIQVEGDLLARSGNISQQAYDQAKLSFIWKDKDIFLNNFEISYQNIALQASGMIDDYENLDIEMEGQGFDIKDITIISEKLPEIKGQANFRGKLSGKISSPSFWGTISSETISYNEIPIEQLSALLQYEDGVLKIKPMKMMNAGSDYTLIGEIHFNDMTMEMQIKSKYALASDLLRFLNLPFKNLEYILGGEIWISGELRKPKVELNVTLDDANNGLLVLTGFYDIDKGLDIQVEGNNFDLAPLQEYLPIDYFDYTIDGKMSVNGKLMKPKAEMIVVLNDKTDGKMKVRGNFDFQSGVMDFKLDGEGFDLRPFESYLPIELDYIASVNLDGTVNGKIDNLNADLDLDILDGMINNNPVKYIGGNLKLENSSKLIFDQKVILSDENNIKIRGNVFLDDKNAPIDLMVEMAQGNLEILRLLIPGVDEADGEGKANLKVTGTLAKPMINGKVSISAGFVNYMGISPIQNIKGEINLIDGKVNFENLSAKYGEGTVSLDGWMILNGFQPEEIDLDVKSKDFHFAYGSIDAMGDANVKLTGLFYTPELRGPIIVHDAEVGVLPFNWPRGGGGSQFAPTFYLELHPGENVRVTGTSPLNMDVTIVKSDTDKLIIDMTGKEVILSGELHSRSGTVNVYSVNFRVTDASASFDKFNKYIPDLRILAQTDIDEYRVFLNIDDLSTEQNWNHELYSEPYLTRNEILNLLASQGVLGELLGEDGEFNVTDMISDEVWRYISQGLRNEFLNKLEKSVEKTLSLDIFQLDPVFLGDLKVNIKVGKYLGDNLYVVYNRTFSQNPEQSIGFEYRIRKGISIEGVYKGSGDYQIGLEANFPF